MTAATDGKAHCEKCRVETSLSLERVRIEGLAAMACPRCGSRMQWGPLPPEEPDWKALDSTQRALDAVQEAIAQVGPEQLAQLQRDLAAVQSQLARARALGVPEGDLEAMTGDPLAVAKELRAQVNERSAMLDALQAQEAALQAKLAPMLSAAREYRLRMLKERDREPWPGQHALQKALTAWAGKFGDAIRKEHRERLAERAALAVGTADGLLPLPTGDVVEAVAVQALRASFPPAAGVG